MRFTLVIFFMVIWAGAFAQYVPEIDSLLKSQMKSSEDPDEGRKQTAYFSIHMDKKYGTTKVREQIVRVLTDPEVSTENKIFFSSLLPPTLTHIKIKKDSLVDLYAGILENNYNEANEKCAAILFLREAAGLYTTTKNYIKAKSIFELADSELKKYQCDIAYIPFYLDISNALYEPLGNTIKANEYNLKALHVIDSLKKIKKEIPTFFELDVFSEIANLNYGKSNWRIAIEYWKKNIALVEKEGKWKNYLTGAYNNIGISYSHLKKYDSALYYLNKCIERARITNDQAWIGIATGNIGDLLAEQGNYTEAIPLLEEDIRIGYEYYQYGTVTLSLGKLGFCYFNLKEYSKAKQYYDSALSVLNRWPTPDASVNYTYSHLTSLNRNYANLQFALGKYKEAFAYQRKAEAFDDSLREITKEQEISSLQVYHEFEQQDTENKLLKTKINEQKLRESRTVIFIMMIVAVVIFVWILYRLRLQKLRAESAALSAEKQVEAERAHRLEEEMKAVAEINRLIQEQTEEQLLLKERELSSITMQIQQKNEVMSHLKNQLGSMAQKETSLQEEFKSIYKSIRKDLNLNADWDKFKLHFEKVHPDFFTKLSTEHPGLSLSDLRICAYLRMNMDNNSMSQILNISPDSLRVRRHRLRKRIGVTADKELYSYLLSL